MTDGGNGLPGLHRIARQVDHRVAHAHLLRGVTARDDERVEIGHARRSGREIRRDHCLSAPALELRSGRGTDDRDGDPCLAQRVERTGELAIFEFVLDEHRDALAR